jgi:hypothetical protein
MLMKKSKITYAKKSRKVAYANKGGAIQNKLKEISGALIKASKMHSAHSKYLSGLIKKIK